jgi:hypothetical protein
VATAGAYVVVDGLLPFVVGPTPVGGRLAVIRLGGHREPHETPWECAAREVREEASLTVCPVAPPTTYWLEPARDQSSLDAAGWPYPVAGDTAPILVAWRTEGGERKYSLMYLAVAAGTPVPATETQGLLLLRRSDVLALVREPATLGEFLRSGGQAVLRAELPLDLPLEPFLQLRVLAALLDRHPDLLPGLR